MPTVDQYIDGLPEERQEICSQLRELVLSLVPGITEKFSFGLPFYHYFGMFLFLRNCPEGIAVTFCRGKDLVTAFPQLQQNNRAIAASVVINTKKEIETLELRELITAAADWNKEAKLLKIPMVSKRKKN